MSDQYHLIRYPGCKWIKHLAIVKHPKLKSHLPETALFNKNSFIKYIHSYPVIFLKPRLGGGGRGVYKIERNAKGYDLYHSVNRTNYLSKRQLFLALQKRCPHNKYIIQQGLNLIRVSKRQVDFRVIILKIQGSWEFFGIMGKCAARNRFVTNQASGGQVIRFRKALRLGLNYNDEQCDTMEKNIRKMSMTIAHALNEAFPNITELGLDIAVDNKERIWLLEANTKPHFNLFKSHEDSALYDKIMTVTERLRSTSPS